MGAGTHAQWLHKHATPGAAVHWSLLWKTVDVRGAVGKLGVPVLAAQMSSECITRPITTNSAVHSVIRWRLRVLGV